MPMECSIDGCTRKAAARGWCHTHYERWRLHGSTEDRPRARDALVRFHALHGEADGCWPWLGFVDDSGYPKFFDGKRMVRAHRWAYEHGLGPLAQGEEPHHECLNAVCVNWAHLKAMTRREHARLHADAITACPQGHQYDEANARWSNGKRKCRACHREWERQRRAANADQRKMGPLAS